MSEILQTDLLLNEVKALIIGARNPSVSFVQRHFKLGYCRASELVAELEGDIVSEKDQSGWRKMLYGPTAGRD